MNLTFALLFGLLQISSSLACNISEPELKFRLGMIQISKSQTLFGAKKPFYIQKGDGDVISQREYTRIIEDVQKVYTPIFKAKGLKLKVETLWEDKQMNAFAGAMGNDRFVLYPGGYARHKLMTEDAFLSVVCHEIGHHLGGFPKKNMNTWSSSEGEADYFSTLKCMREVLKLDSNNKRIALKLELPAEVKRLCKHQFPNVSDYYICLRNAKASEDHGKVIADINTHGGNTEVSLLTPSKDIVSSSILTHPDAQCRLDTKYQGALCNVSEKISLDDVDEVVGACHYNNFNIIGNRPACWFAHKK